MRCNNCGRENELDSKFCVSCGSKLEMVNSVSNSVNTNTEEGPQHTKLSIAALICLVISFTAPPLGYYTSIKLLYEIPWFLISLVLTVISKVRYKDRMSKVLLIIELIIIGVSVVLIIVSLIFLAMIFKMLFNAIENGGCDVSAFE